MSMERVQDGCRPLDQAHLSGTRWYIGQRNAHPEAMLRVALLIRFDLPALRIIDIFGAKSLELFVL